MKPHHRSTGRAAGRDSSEDALGRPHSGCRPEEGDFVLVYGGVGTKGFAVSQPYKLERMAVAEAKSLSLPGSYGGEVRIAQLHGGRMREIGKATHGVFLAVRPGTGRDFGSFALGAAVGAFGMHLSMNPDGSHTFLGGLSKKGRSSGAVATRVLLRRQAFLEKRYDEEGLESDERVELDMIRRELYERGAAPNYTPVPHLPGRASGRRGKTRDPSAWAYTPAGTEAYRIARADAQRRANETGFDHGLERNDLFKQFSVFMLPSREHRTGHELRAEVVMCENLAKCQRGHGPVAGRISGRGRKGASLVLSVRDTKLAEDRGPAGDAFRRKLRNLAQARANRLGKAVEVFAAAKEGGWVVERYEPSHGDY